MSASLRLDGLVRRHGACRGGNQLPADLRDDLLGDLEQSLNERLGPGGSVPSTEEKGA